ncbi:hypothetical protein TRFO_01878 [Tritrichomonas foetus]|uniref:VPS9 domain-containing protein n=1 Tax=Tritrichomonas foetus TaxID=1144522 RepID=A0A1J4JI11_9EUKA|nr:hypothetical protein TRFO_01878 [Tritrichomonas foetus]|eukprot:OHS98816.1 hypothetical protein TRFO_01878 [Tritrichomonas foetus]
MSGDSQLGILRQLLDREQAFFDIEHQQAKLFEKDSFNSIKQLVFLTRKVYSLHLSVLEQSRTGQPIDVPDLSELSGSLPQGYSATHQRSFQTAVSSLLATPSSLAEPLSKYIDENPDQENYVVFSLIPALFSCLWSLEEANRFVDLLLEFPSKHYPSLTRLLLVHPSFFVFLSSIQSDVARLLGSEKLELCSLIDLFMSRLFLFPASLRSLITKTSDPINFFTECVLKPILSKPSLYGLVPSNEFRTFESLLNNFETGQIERIVNALKNQENTIQMQPSENTLASVIAANEQLIYLLKDDCVIIQKITNSDIITPQSEGVYQVPCKRVVNVPQIKASNSVFDIDPFESLLRALVIQLDVSHSEANIIDTLDAALMLHAGASRLQFELRLDEFKQMKKQRNAPDDVSYYVQLLTSAYEQRMKHRKATLSNSTASDVFKVQHLQSSQAVQFLMETRQMTFFSMWVETGPFKNIEAKIPEFCSNRKSFATTYKNLINQFMAFAEEKKLNIKKDQFIPIVYNRLTQIMTLSAFQKHHPELVELDKKIHEMISNNKEQLYSSNQLPFLQAFKDDPKLMGLAADHLKRAFDEDSAIPIAEWIDRALSALIHVLSFQGYKEIGADHWLPMTLILFIHVNPPNVASVASYMHQFLLELPDSIPISQSIEYNMTMTHSAASYFQRELEKYEKK